MQIESMILYQSKDLEKTELLKDTQEMLYDL